ncbi:hypothetical protein BDZ91DRAFT_726516 [Kalaharituber pfeilii]|nr:hypothetical protein BDZ91DRAFT_726516 [Kalaharituber pfeilii]
MMRSFSSYGSRISSAIAIISGWFTVTIAPDVLTPCFFPNNSAGISSIFSATPVGLCLFPFFSHFRCTSLFFYHLTAGPGILFSFNVCTDFKFVSPTTTFSLSGIVPPILPLLPVYAQFSSSLNLSVYPRLCISHDLS